MGSGLINAALLAAEAQPSDSAGPLNQHPLVKFIAGTGSVPPAANYITKDDQLLVALFTSVSINFALHVRMLMPDGSIQIQREVFAGSGARTVQLLTFPLPEGFLLSLDLAASQVTTLQRGQAWAKVLVSRSIGGGIQLQTGLTQGFISNIGGLSWPNLQSEYNSRGPGATTIETVSNPGVGLDWTTTVQTSTSWLLQSVTAILTTNATVANRIPHLQIFDGATAVWDVPAMTQEPATNTVRYTWHVGAAHTAGAVDFSQVMALPQGIRIVAGLSVRTLTTAIQAGDQWSAIRLIVQEYVAP